MIISLSPGNPDGIKVLILILLDIIWQI